MTLTIYTNFGSPFPRRLHINLALIGQAVAEEMMFEIVEGQDDNDNRHRLDGYAISSPCKPNGSGELKIMYTPRKSVAQWRLTVMSWTC